MTAARDDHECELCSHLAPLQVELQSMSSWLLVRVVTHLPVHLLSGLGCPNPIKNCVLGMTDIVKYNFTIDHPVKCGASANKVLKYHTCCQKQLALITEPFVIIDGQEHKSSP